MLLQVLRLTQDACQILCTLTGHAGRVCSLAFHPEGAVLLSGSEDQSTRAWDLPHELQQAQRERTSQQLREQQHAERSAMPQELQQAEQDVTSQPLKQQQQQDGATARPQELQQQQREESSATPHELQQAEPSARHQQLEGQTKRQQPKQQPSGTDGKGQSWRQQAPEAAGSHQGEPSETLMEVHGGPAAQAGSGLDHTEASSSALPGREAATEADRPQTAAAALAARSMGSANSEAEAEAAAELLGGHTAAVEGRSNPCLGEANAAHATAQTPGSSLEVASPLGADPTQPHHPTAGTRAASPPLIQGEGPATSRVLSQPASPSGAAESPEGDKLPPLPANVPQELLAPHGIQSDTEGNSGPQAPLQGRDSAAEGLQAAAWAARPPVAGGRAQKKAAARYLPSLGAQQLVTADGAGAKVSRQAAFWEG